MRHVMAVAALVLALAGCGGADPLPEGSTDFPTGSPTATTVPPSPATAEPDPEPESAAASTCDVAREAFLTGTEAEIEAALAALVADTTADASAREAAQSYLEEDDPTLRALHEDLVQYTCSIP